MKEKFYKEKFYKEKFYKEEYYKGGRFKSTLLRFIGYTKKSIHPSTNFTPIKIINSPKQTKGVISFSLFGNDSNSDFWPELIEPLLRTSKLIKQILPDWHVRVYISSRLSQKIYDTLIRVGFELVILKEDPKQPFSGLLWRFLAAGETLPFLVCDADMALDKSSLAIPGINEMKKWLKSNKTFFHRKNFPINYFWPICAGMWGGKPSKDGEPAIPKVKELLEGYTHDWFGCDESFLRKEAWPLFKTKGCYTTYSKSEKAFWVLLILIILTVLAIIIYKKVKYKKGKYKF